MPPLIGPHLYTQFQTGQASLSSKTFSSCASHWRHACGSLHPSWSVQARVLQATFRSICSERNTYRGGADKESKEAYLEVLEGLLWHQGLDVACCGGKDTDRRGPREFFLFIFVFWLFFISYFSVQFSSVQSLCHGWLFVIPWTAACQASLSITNAWSLLKLMSVMSVMPFNHLILCHPLLLPPSIFPSIRVFSNELVLHIRWPKYWSFSFSISPSNEFSRLISFRIDCLISLLSKGFSKVFSSTTIQKHQLFSAQSSLWSNSNICTWLLEKP